MTYLLIVWVTGYASITKLLPLSYPDRVQCELARKEFVTAQGAYGACIPYTGGIGK